MRAVSLARAVAWRTLAAVIAVALVSGAGLHARDAAGSRDQAPLSPDQIERFLKEAKIVASKPIGKGITKPWRLTLSDGSLTHDAAFQSINESKEHQRFRDGREERQFRDYYGYNIAAYRLARLLGYDDLVPVSVERRWRGNIGALTWWVVAKWDEGERVKAGAEPPDRTAWEQQVYLARVFTALVDDTDRNLGNQLVTEDFHVWLIDFTRGFRRTPTLKASGMLRRCDRKLFERLQTLTDEELTRALRPYVDGLAIRALLSRRAAIVEHFTKEAAQRGDSAVFH